MFVCIAFVSSVITLI